jgi:uncharacterized membrane protein
MGIAVIFGLLVVVTIIGTPVAFLTFFLSRKHIEKRAIARSLEKWKTSHLIDDETYEKLSIDFPKTTKKHHWSTMQITYFVGSLFIGIGFILFIASNWELIASWAKLALVLFLAGIALLTGEYLRKKTKRALPYLGEGLIFLSSLLWGAGIIFLFQSAQWSIHYNALILAIWILSILPLYLWLKSDPIAYLCIFLGFLWTIFMRDLYPSYTLMFYFLPLVFWYLIAKDHLYKEAFLWLSAFLIIPFIRSSGVEISSYLVVLCFFFAILSSFHLLKSKNQRSSIYFALASLAFVFFSFSNWNVWSLAFWLVWLFLLAWFSFGLFQRKEVLPFNLVLAGVHIRVFAGLQTTFMNRPSDVWHPEGVMIVWLLFSSVALALSVFLKRFPALQISLRWLSYIVMMISLFFLSSNQFLTSRLPYQTLQNSSLILTQQLFLASLILISIGILTLYRIKNRANIIFHFPFLFLIASNLLGFGVLLLFPLLSTALVLKVYLYNAVLLLLIISTFFWANQEEDPLLYYAGMASLLLFIILRYTDLFWKLLDRSVFFILGGLVLLTVGIVLEKQKKHIIEGSPSHENS